MKNRVYLKDLRADLLFVWEWHSELSITTRKQAYELAQRITRALNTDTIFGNREEALSLVRKAIA